jgi:RHS repeat-associated protein
LYQVMRRQHTCAQDDRLAGVSYTGAVNPTPNVGFADDPYFPRRVSMTDGTGVTQYAYVPVGSFGALQVQQETTALTGATIAYAYDALGRLSRRTVAGQGAETFAYDPLSRPIAHSGDLGSFAQGYLGETGQIASRALASSTLATSWSYLPNAGDRRLAGVATTGLAAGQSTAFAFTSKAGNFITGQTQTTDAAIPYPPASGSAGATFNTLNQMATMGFQALTWDANGNLLSDGAHAYSWDAENRLVAIAYTGQPTQATAFAYDGLGRRVQIVSTPAGGGAVTTNYVWCGMRPCQARSASNAVTRGYYAEGEVNPGSPSAYYAPDQIGSVRRVFTSATAPSYDYDPYGAPLQATAQATDYVWAGMFNQADAGLYLTPYRAYSPALGRWLSRDPVGEGTDPDGNLYVYVGGNPVSLSDPIGLATLQIGISGSFNLLPGVSVPLSAGIVVDNEGNVGTYSSIGAGAQLGAAVDAGVSVQWSNAKTICDLTGPFYNLSVHGGAGLGGSLDYFRGGSRHGEVVGGGVTFGGAAGASASATYTNTWVKPILGPIAAGGPID